MVSRHPSLKELREKDKAGLEQLRADVAGLVRVVNELDLINLQLRQRLSTPAPAVVVLAFDTAVVDGP